MGRVYLASLPPLGPPFHFRNALCKNLGTAIEYKTADEPDNPGDVESGERWDGESDERALGT
eukprot:3141047-Pyramimonas_sp.AAC.1